MTALLFAFLLASQAASNAGAGLGAASPRAPLTGQNVVGTVTNTSTGAPLADAPVSLVLLQGSMPKDATATTDARGHYRFSTSGSGPYMVEADWQGVPYFAKVAAGQSETNVSVYNASSDAKLVQVDAEIMVLQPDQGQLAVVNEYRIENGVQPLRTLYRKGGLFRFRVPKGAQVDMVRVVAPGEMPLAREPQPTAEHDVYSVDSPLRPGETRVQISYRVPYATLKAALSETPVTRPAHFEVYVPQPMAFAGNGFTQVGMQDGYKVYGIATGLVAATESFSVSGDAPLPTAPVSDQAGAPASSAAPAEVAPAPDTAAAAVPTPTFLERNRWTVLALLALILAAGFGIMLARPEPKVANRAPAIPLPGAEPDALVKLKDDLFLLEVRHHTGDLAETDYARLRAALDERMRTLARR